MDQETVTGYHQMQIIMHTCEVYNTSFVTIIGLLSREPCHVFRVDQFFNFKMNRAAESVGATVSITETYHENRWMSVEKSS